VEAADLPPHVRSRSTRCGGADAPTRGSRSMRLQVTPAAATAGEPARPMPAPRRRARSRTRRRSMRQTASGDGSSGSRSHESIRGSGGKEVQLERRPAVAIRFRQIGLRLGQRFRLEGRHLFAELQVAVKIEVEMLPSGPRSPRHEVFDVIREGSRARRVLLARAPWSPSRQVFQRVTVDRMLGPPVPQLLVGQRSAQPRGVPVNGRRSDL